MCVYAIERLVVLGNITKNFCRFVWCVSHQNAITAQFFNCHSADLPISFDLLNVKSEKWGKRIRKLRQSFDLIPTTQTYYWILGSLLSSFVSKLLVHVLFNCYVLFPSP